MITLAQEVIGPAQGAQRAWPCVWTSVSLGQYGLEGAWGRAIPKGSNNPFGIKAAKGEPSVEVPTHEFVGGRFVLVHAAFAVFASLDAAFLAHAKLLATHEAYADFRAARTVQAACDALTGTYATDPDYGLRLWSVICSEDLTRYDLARPVPTPL